MYSRNTQHQQRVTLVSLGLALILLLSATPAWSGHTPLGVWDVDQTAYADDTGCNAVIRHCATIQAAINAAVAGDTIIVQPGTYDQRIVIASKSLTIRGADRDTTIITNTAANEEVVFIGTNAGSVFANGLIFENFTVRGTSALVGDRDVIKFRAAGGAAPVIVRNNTLDCAGNFTTGAGARLAIEEANQPNPGNALIEGNLMKDCTSFGMFTNSLTFSTIRNNTIMNSGAGGLYLDSSGLGNAGNANVTVVGNTITGSAARWTPAFGDNPFFGALGIASTSSDINVTNNNVVDNLKFGVVIRERALVSLVNVHINQNNIVNNTNGSINNVDIDNNGSIDVNINATCNWWGAADGPSGGATDPATGVTASGSGDEISEGFFFDPWLVGPAPLGNCGNVAAEIDVIPQKINTNSKGLIPVVIYHTNDLNASRVNVSTVCFGDAEVPAERDCSEAHAEGHLVDHDGDGDLDMLLHFETQETGIDAGDTEACLTGMTNDGVPFEGCDEIEAFASGKP